MLEWMGMRIIADFHIHSPYARAVSKEMTLENLDHWARLKGITVMGTGDFTHPAWMKEIKSQLEPAEPGLYQLRIRGTAPDATRTRFVLTVEISSIYKKNGKTRRVHTLIFAPSVESAEKISTTLGWRGNLKSDGRPILGLDVKELAKIVFDIDERCMVVPAHCLLPDAVVHTGEGIKEIQHTREGDHVYTHQGRLRRVKKVYTRPYRGIIYHIKPWYFRPGLETTPEHPFFAIKTQKHCAWQHGFCRPHCSGRSHCCRKHRANSMQWQPQWIQAKDLEVHDVLVFPRCTETQDIHSFLLSDATSAMQGVVSAFTVSDSGAATLTMRGTRARVFINQVPVDKAFCRLAGYFVAEGSTKGREGISFTFATHEKKYQEDVKGLMFSLFGIPCANERKKGGGVELIFYSKILTQVFSTLFYRRATIKRAHTKALPQWMLRLPGAKQAEIFKGWWRGDAGYTTSRELMNQMKMITLRLGIIPSIMVRRREVFHKGTHGIDGRVIIANHDIFHFTALAFSEDKFGLRKEDIFQKARFNPRLSRRHGWMDDSFIYLPVRDIERKKYEGTVYNLEVEEDHSYLTEFAAVHNCWTPWFSVFGSMSGFDSLEECFEEYAPHIYAVETGLSSDPAMNWRLSSLDAVALISNSDSHSLQRIGREANVFNTELSYAGIMGAIRARDPARFLFTIEFFPEEGKYHYDGHRACKFSSAPEETKRLNKLCKVCGKPMTVGVLFRVDELADRAWGQKPDRAIPYKSLVPLNEIVAESFQMGTAAKKVKDEYMRLVRAVGSEFSVLVDASRADLAVATAPEVVEGIMRVRNREVHIEPGYDGEYGIVRIFTEQERIAVAPQAALF